MYVQYVKLAQPKGALPMLLWHGGGLTGVTWETKPDGKPGWQQFFLNAGHDVYVSDAVERGRASWSRYPEVYKCEPVFRTKKEAWETFRIGPSYEIARRGSRSRPALSGRSVRPFRNAERAALGDQRRPDAGAYDALVDKVCPCVVVVHSQGGNFGFNATLAAPGKVKALIAVEPSGAPDPSKATSAWSRTCPISSCGATSSQDRALAAHPGLHQISRGPRGRGGKADLFVSRSWASKATPT